MAKAKRVPAMLGYSRNDLKDTVRRLEEAHSRLEDDNLRLQREVHIQRDRAVKLNKHARESAHKVAERDGEIKQLCDENERLRRELAYAQRWCSIWRQQVIELTHDRRS